MQLEWAINRALRSTTTSRCCLSWIPSITSSIWWRRLEQWMKDGKLNHVAPGEPAVDEVDLQSFLEAGGGL